MRIVVLVENSDGEKGCASEHGLSIYVETNKHRILSDTGATGAFAENAQQLGIDLSAVDLVCLSHGHYDHAGGILTFYEQNQTAPIYMQETAVEEYYAADRFIGIDQRICKLPTVRYLKGNGKIDEEVELFSGVTERKLWPSGNSIMRRKKGEAFVPDTFDHEQSLVIHGDKEVLICGCAHCGILNILDRYREMFHRDPDIVIGGFHLMKKEDYTEEERRTVTETARELAKKKTLYYTGHCTGGKALILMAPILKEKLIPLHSGMEIPVS